MSKENEQLTDFEQGRKNAFESIRAQIDYDVLKHAEQIAKDFMIQARPEGDLRAIDMDTDISVLVPMVLAPASENFRQYIVQGLDALEKGTSLYELTGETEIYSYHNITDGDYNAGVMSAVMDAQYLLMTMGYEPMIKACMERLFMPKAITEKIPLKTIELMVGSGIAVRTDIMLSKIDTNVRKTHKRPKEVHLDHGTEAVPMPKKVWAEHFGDLTDPSNKFSHLKGRTPVSWPPFHGEMKQLFNAAASTYSPDHIQPTIAALEDNEGEEFTKGFQAALREIYIEFQSIHFDQKHNKPGYEGRLGLFGLGGGYVNRIVDDAFGTLRTSISEQLHETAKGEGESFADGQKAAAIWTMRELQVLRLPGSMGEDPNNVKILNSIKRVWEQDLAKIGQSDIQAANPEATEDKSAHTSVPLVRRPKP